jgi:Tfp pilus assembly protein PilV
VKIRGLSLIEVVVASFLMVSCLVVFGSLLLTSTRYGHLHQGTSQALEIAQRHLEEVRRLARSVESGRYGFDNLVSQAPRPDDYDPAFTVSHLVETWNSFSPCDSLEQVQDSSMRRLLSSSLKRVEIVVAWSRGRYELVSLVGDPRRDLPASGALEISPIGPLPASLRPDETVDFQARLLDRYGHPVPDAFFVWNPSPLAVPVQVLPAREGRRCTLRNRMQLGPEPASYPGGRAGVIVEGYYNGRGQLEFGPEVNLEGP